MSIFENSPALVFLCGFLVLYVAMHWVEGKSKLCSKTNAFTEIFGESNCSLFKSNERDLDDQTIAELRERIATLEKIVTDSRYELDQKINRL